MSTHSLAHPVTSIRGSSDVHIHDAAFSNTMKRATMLILVRDEDGLSLLHVYCSLRIAQKALEDNQISINSLPFFPSLLLFP